MYDNNTVFEILQKIENESINSLNENEIDIIFNEITELFSSSFDLKQNIIDNSEIINISNLILNEQKIKINDINNIKKEMYNILLNEYDKNKITSLEKDITTLNEKLLINFKETKLINLFENMIELDALSKKYNNKEIALFIDYHTGNKIINSQFIIGTQNNVNPNEEFNNLINNNMFNSGYDFFELIISHNHPNNSYFSLNDIEYFVENIQIKEMILLSNDDIYIITKKNKDLDKELFLTSININNIINKKDLTNMMFLEINKTINSKLEKIDIDKINEKKQLINIILNHYKLDFELFKKAREIQKENMYNFIINNYDLKIINKVK